MGADFQAGFDLTSPSSLTALGIRGILERGIELWLPLVGVAVPFDEGSPSVDLCFFKGGSATWLSWIFRDGDGDRDLF